MNTSVLAPNNVEPQTSKSKNSETASSGFKAETILCVSPDVLEQLGLQYFGKQILSCKTIGGNKKSDNLIIFEDGSQTVVQLKNGTGGGRGWSFDRRHVDNLPTNDSVKELIKVVCLKSGNERTVVPMDKELLRLLLLGDDEATKPQHFLHTIIQDGKIVSLSACPAPLFIDIIMKDVYEICNAKKTCIHLTPLIYLQRKAGGKEKETYPNDIQAKLKKMPDCMAFINLHQTKPVLEQQMTLEH